MQMTAEAAKIGSAHQFIVKIIVKFNILLDAGASLLATVKDVDNDGEEEMIFSSERTNPPPLAPQKPLLLKGVRDFLPYSQKK
jgi:hypothetical protein